LDGGLFAISPAAVRHYRLGDGLIMKFDHHILGTTVPGAPRRSSVPAPSGLAAAPIPAVGSIATLEHTFRLQFEHELFAHRASNAGTTGRNGA
jgi:hypothetical protein